MSNESTQTVILPQDEYPNYHFADQLISEIKADIDELDELDPIFLLDVMSALGIQFSQGHSCQKEYEKICTQLVSD
jgi:hypothetical protein